MLTFKDKLKKIKKSHLLIAGVVLLILLFISLLWFSDSASVQAELPLSIEVYFEGEYRVADGPWMTYVEGEHIPATKGDVTLRGNLYKRYEGENLGIYNSEDMPVAFYTNHIKLTFIEIDETGEKFSLVSDSENPLFGASECGKSWTAHQFMSDPENPIEILIHNPHGYGNETAIDEMLSGMTLWLGIEFEKGILDSGATERNAGIMIVMASIMLLGIALFSSLIHVKILRSFGCSGVSFYLRESISRTMPTAWSFGVTLLF